MSYLSLWDRVLAQKACQPSEWSLFVREPWEDHGPATAICATCPVREDCRALAAGMGATAGVWGGELATEHRPIRKTARERGVESPDSSALPGPTPDDAAGAEDEEAA